MISSDTQKLLVEVIKNWQAIRDKLIISEEKHSSEKKTAIGEIYWDNPNVVWVLATKNEESYEGSQTQIGVDKDGVLRWEYQSHCSCDGYEDTCNLPSEVTEKTLKSFQLRELPLTWESELRDNMVMLLRSIK